MMKVTLHAKYIYQYLTNSKCIWVKVIKAKYDIINPWDIRYNVKMSLLVESRILIDNIYLIYILSYVGSFDQEKIIKAERTLLGQNRIC